VAGVVDTRLPLESVRYPVSLPGCPYSSGVGLISHLEQAARLSGWNIRATGKILHSSIGAAGEPLLWFEGELQDPAMLFVDYENMGVRPLAVTRQMLARTPLHSWLGGEEENGVEFTSLKQASGM